MIKNNTIIATLLVYLLLIPNFSTWAAGIGNDANPSSMAATLNAFYLPTPMIFATRQPYGGNICTLDSNTGTNGFKSASAKWRNPSIAGTINLGESYEIQRTNISGIGVIARLGAQFDDQSRAPAGTIVGDQYRTITQTVNSGAKSVIFGNKYWGLVTIPGEPLIPGTYNLGQAETMVDVWCQSVDGSNDAHGGGYLSGTVVINAPTCYLGPEVASIMTLNLGNYGWSDVRNLSVGSNFGSAAKLLTMECKEGSWPKVTVSDKNNSNNSSTIVSLTNPDSASTAQGVGVQIFLNNQSIAQQLATKINLTSSKLTEDKTINLPIEFKYIKTSETISTGEANAIVDLTFTYD